MQLEHKDQIRADLKEWGLWAQDCPSRSLNFPSSEPYTVKKGGTGLTISDDYALVLDQAIANLYHNDPDFMWVIKWHFVCGFSSRDIEEITKRSRKDGKPQKTKKLSHPTVQRMILSIIQTVGGYVRGRMDK